MPRIHPLTTDAAGPRSVELLEKVGTKLGRVPNLLATMAQAPSVLEAYLAFGQAMGGGTLPAALREQIAVAVAAENECGYCASAHTAIGRRLGVSDEELARNLSGRAEDDRTQAALTFARAVVQQEGWVTDEQFRDIREAGYDDGAILEIIAVVALNILTNYLNHAIGTEIDFPLVQVRDVAAPA